MTGPDQATPPDDAAPTSVADARIGQVRSIAGMSTGTALSRITGLVRVSVTFAALGLSPVSNAYVSANTTPNMLYELVLGGILTSVFVPFLVGWTKEHSEEDRWDVASRFMTLTLLALSVVAIVGAIAAPWIMSIYLSGVADPVSRQEQIELGTFFLRWFMPQIVFYGMGAVAGGVLTANRRFAAQMFAPILNNVAVILTMVAFIVIHDGAPLDVSSISTGEKTLLAAGTTLGVVAMTVALWPSLRRLGFRWRLRLPLRHPSVRRLVDLARWVIVYVAANQLAYFVIITMNNRISTGAYTAYAGAFIVFSLPHAIVAVSIFTALLPSVSERWAEDDRVGVRELFSRGMRDTLILMIPAAVGFIALAGPIVSLLAEHGAVTESDTALVARTLMAFAVGLPFFSSFQLLTRTLYAGRDSRTPALVNVAVAAVNLGANLILAFRFDLGVPGLALGYAISYMAGTLLLLIALRRRLGQLDGRRIWGTVARAAAAALVTGLVAFASAAAVAAVADVTRTGVRAIQVGVAVTLGVLVFVASAAIFGVQEIGEIRGALRARARR